MARLLLMTKTSSPKQIDLADERILIGRDATNDLQIDRPRVSRHHAELRTEGGTTWVIDLASSNGTFVNGHKIQHRALRHGDVIRVGDIELRYLNRQNNYALPQELTLAE
jgi:pSer/pThr/pTyr-binding forkhead associated (FHA) protein